MKKALIIILSVALIVGCALLSSCELGTPINDLYSEIVGGESGVEGNILFLGDSIAEALVGPSPIVERDNYGYFALVGRRSGMNFINRAVSGHKSENMLDYISKADDDKNPTYVQTYISQADVISISMLGNDLLLDDMEQMVLEATSEKYTTEDALLSASSNNLKAIIDLIYQLNPDVKIILQTLYNPTYVESRLIDEDIREILVNKKYEESEYRGVVEKIIVRLNDVLYAVAEEKNCEIIDVFGAFDKVFEKGEAEGKKLIYSDGVHPTNYGHAVIADLLQAKLSEMGYSKDGYALNQYKQIKSEQISRMFGDIKEETCLKIKSATTLEEITEIYFNAIDDITPEYESEKSSLYVPESEKEYFVEDTVYTIKYFNFFHNTLNLAPFFDAKQSTFSFGSDGICRVTVALDYKKISALESLLSGLDLSDVTLNDPVIMAYANEFFPGFNPSDLKVCFQKMSTVGIKFIYDADDTGIKSLKNSIETTGSLPESLTIPKKLGIQIEINYSLHTIHSDTSGDHQVAYLGNYCENGQTMFYISIYTDANGKQCATLYNEMLPLTINAELNK